MYTPYEKEKYEKFADDIGKEIESLESLISRTEDKEESLRYEVRKEFYENIMGRLALGFDLPEIKSVCAQQYLMTKALLEAQRQVYAKLEMIMRGEKDDIQLQQGD